jgi:hypothetical protein
LEGDAHGGQLLLLCARKIRDGRGEQSRLGRAGEVIESIAVQSLLTQRIQGRQSVAGFIPNPEIGDITGFHGQVASYGALQRDVPLQQTHRAACIYPRIT